MQTKPSPNMPRARMPAPPHLPEMFHLEEGADFPAEVVHVVGVTKAAFNAVPKLDFTQGGHSCTKNNLFEQELTEETEDNLTRFLAGGC
jgi:hypothetical protein